MRAAKFRLCGRCFYCSLVRSEMFSKTEIAINIYFFKTQTEPFITYATHTTNMCRILCSNETVSVQKCC